MVEQKPKHLLESCLKEIESFSLNCNLKKDTHTYGINNGEYEITYRNVDGYISTMIDTCVKMYQNVSLIRNIVDLMGDFSAEGIQIAHKNNSVNAFFKTWARKTKIDSRMNIFLTNFFKTGNVFIWRVLGNLDFVAKNARRGSIEIPIGYRELNPQSIKITGDEFLGTREFYLKSSSLSSVGSSASSDSGDIEFSKVFKGKKSESGDILLDSERIFTMQYKKDDWHKWALPLLYPISHDADFKMKLREMDKAAIDSIVHVMTIFKLGSDEYPATEPLFKKLAGILGASTPSFNLLWDNNIEVEQKYLPVEKIIGGEKYTQINSDIMSGLGVPSILVNGDGANFSNSFLQVKTLVERLKNAQNKAIEFLRKETEFISDSLGFRNYPEVRIDAMSLRDVVAEKKLIIQLLDRNVISQETALRYFGEIHEIEIERMKDEKQEGEVIDVEKLSPFTPNTGGQPGQGSPSDPKEPTDKDRETRPQGFGQKMKTYAPEVLDRCVEKVKKQKIEEYKKKNGKNPGKIAMKNIEKSAFAICQSSVGMTCNIFDEVVQEK